MQPSQRVEQRLGNESPQAKLHQAVERGANGFQAIDALGTDVHPQILRSRRGDTRRHLRNDLGFGLSIGRSGAVLKRPACQRQRCFRQVSMRRKRRQKCHGEIEVFDSDKIERSGNVRVNRGLARPPQILRRQRIQFPGSAVEYLRLQGRSIGCGIAKSAGPGQALTQRVSVQSRRGLHIHDIAGIEFQVLGDFEVAVAPREADFRGGVQHGAGIQHFAR